MFLFIYKIKTFRYRFLKSNQFRTKYNVNSTGAFTSRNVRLSLEMSLFYIEVGVKWAWLYLVAVATVTTVVDGILCYNCTAVDIRSTTAVIIDKFDSFAKRLDKECHTPKGQYAHNSVTL